MIDKIKNIILKKDKKIEIFISHWNEEKLLAEWLKKFLIEENDSVSCFCSSRDIEIGEWRKRIEEKARETNIALLMLSPFSKANEWILYESGIVYGANKNNLIVPVLFGGAKIEDIPNPALKHQALLLNNENSFNDIIPQILKKAPSKNNYEKFISSMEHKIKRLCIYGHNSLMISKPINTEKKEVVFKVNKQTEKFERNSTSGEISALRLSMIPRNADGFIHWKTGLKIMKNGERVFEIHAGCHRGYRTWTIKHIPKENNYKYELPAKLDMDSNCSILLWFEESRRNISIDLVDSTGSHKLFLTDTNKPSWNLLESDWDSIEVAGWCDSEEEEHKFIKYKTDAVIEIDRS